MAFLLSLFGAVAVQKNIRDMEYLRQHNSNDHLELKNNKSLSENEPLD